MTAEVFNKIIGAFLVGVFFILSSSCSENVEVWKSSYQLMKSNETTTENTFTDNSQYLLLYHDGKATLVDSLVNGKTRLTKAHWEIFENKGGELFSLNSDQEQQGIRGIVYPIIKKDELEFNMKFDFTANDGQFEQHIWNLKRIKNHRPFLQTK